jgi:DNA repair protein RadC
MDPVSRALAALRPLAQHLRHEVALVLPGDADPDEGSELVAVGDARSVALTPADALSTVLRRGWASYLLVHTHLDDEPPSVDDIRVTRRLVSASHLVGVPLVGHLILGPTKAYDCFAA